MTTHSCPRCGYEDHCSYGSWFDRHAFIGVVGVLFALVFMTGVVATYPILGCAMIGSAALGLGVRARSRKARWREATIRRAEYENALLTAHSAPQLPPPVVHVMQAPTAPLIPTTPICRAANPHPQSLTRTPRQQR